MLKKSLLTLLLIVVVIGGLAWFKRIDLMLALVKYQSGQEYVVAPKREIPWAKGPQDATESPANRPPNIILILADDDYMTRDKRTGQLNNPGRTAAKAVARKTERCDFVWPVFKPTNRGPKDTDFNDLHVLEGLGAVSDQLMGVIQEITKHHG